MVNEPSVFEPLKFYCMYFFLFLGLEDLGCIGECVGLERLDLSFNSFSKLHRLASLEKLQYLNLSANRITSVGKCHSSSYRYTTLQWVAIKFFLHKNISSLSLQKFLFYTDLIIKFLYAQQNICYRNSLLFGYTL